MTTYGVAARRNSTEPGSMAYMAKDGPDITQKVLGDEAFNNKWGCKNNIEPDGTKGPHREWRFGKCRDCGMGEGKYTQAFQEWQGGGTVTGDRRSRGGPSEEVVSTEPVLVQVRIRPLNAIERARGDHECVHCADDGCTIQFVSAARGRGGGTAEQAPVQQLTFDATLHGPSQASVFRSVGATKLLEDALNGYAVTVFAYGQTGSGKTYTMSGADPDGGSPPTTASYTGADDGPEGLIPRALGALFALIGRAQAGGAPPTSVRASYLELYNEQINDLLNPASTNLNLRWNASAGAFVQDLLQVECENVGDAQLVFEEGTRNRKVGSHSMNKDSSRSHCIMTLHIGSAQTGRMGKLSFVDLAGSERLVETRHNTSGSGIKEAGHINKSLFTLCHVISALSDPKKKGGHIPYRDSKLTRLLIDSLGGDGRTMMLACISPSSHHLEETINTLHFASRAKNITNRPVAQVDTHAELLSQMQQSLHLLREENQTLKMRLVVAPSSVATPATGGGRPTGSAGSAGSRGSSAEMMSTEGFSAELKGLRGEKLELAVLRQENATLRRSNEVLQASNELLLSKGSQLQEKLARLEMIFGGSDGQATPTSGDRPFGE